VHQRDHSTDISCTSELIDHSDELLRRIVTTMRSVAVVGVSDRPERPSHQVARYLLDHGVEVFPVNPRLGYWLGRPVHPSLAELPGPVDVVDVFRRPEAVPDVARQAVALRCKVLWLQLGVTSAEGRRIAVEGGLEVVEDRCLKVEHLLLAR